MRVSVARRDGYHKEDGYLAVVVGVRMAWLGGEGCEGYGASRGLETRAGQGCGDLCRHEAGLLLRAEARRRTSVPRATVHAAAERGRTLGRDEEAARRRGGVSRSGRGLPAGRAGGRGEVEEVREHSLFPVADCKCAGGGGNNRYAPRKNRFVRTTKLANSHCHT